MFKHLVNMKLIPGLTVLFAATYSTSVAQLQSVTLNVANRENLMPIVQADGTIGFVVVSDIAKQTPVIVSLSDVTYYLFTRSNIISPTIITNANITQVKSSPFSSTKLTVFISHGWNNNHESPVNTEITSAILATQDLNVFVVDWSGLANSLYLIAKNAVPQVGRFEGEFIKNIQSTYGLSGDDFILIGHSLGAHVAGCAGAALGGNVNTVIGLDPAGPLYSPVDTTVRIDRTDGKFVHVIHTDGAVLGDLDPMGHADYYPNGGVVQPGCGADVARGCAHNISHVYFTESIRDNQAFIGRKCTNYCTFQNGFCSNNSISPMGGILVDKIANGAYYLITNLGSPYGRH